jgi:hypothetical protein
MPRPLMQWDPTPKVPPLSFSRWAQFSPPWFDLVAGRDVDTVRTARLPEVDDVVRLSPTTPLQNAARGNTTVIGFTDYKVHRVPLPGVVWILKNGDDQWFGQSATHYWEASALGPTLLGWWRADSVRVWDVTKPWWETMSVSGGGVPIWAMTPTPDELARGAGGVRHSLALTLSTNYSPEKVSGWMKSDGTDPTHPLRSGECLRLTDVAHQRRLAEAQTPDDFAVIHALRFHGCRVNDKGSRVAGHNLRMPAGANVTVRLRLTDFEVVVS